MDGDRRWNRTAGGPENLAPMRRLATDIARVAPGKDAMRGKPGSIHVGNQARIRLFFRFFRVPCAAVPDLSTAFPTGGAVRARRKRPPGRPRPARG